MIKIDGKDYGFLELIIGIEVAWNIIKYSCKFVWFLAASAFIAVYDFSAALVVNFYESFVGLF